MAIKSEKIDGTKIINEVESSNLSKTEYDTATKKMLVTFKNGLQYENEDVPNQTYTRFRMSCFLSTSEAADELTRIHVIHVT